jgi:peptidoglycan/xylan/chitin deacetylase (PgdA/CDA1 family)
MQRSEFIMSFILLLFSEGSFSQGVVAPYQVGPWQGFRPAAISYTFDDNCTNQLAVVVPMFNEFDYKLTLFTVIDWGPNWNGLQNAVSHGHEVASHTLSHPSLGTLSDSMQTIELADSKSIIDDHITGQRCMTLAYPNCVVGNTSIVKQYYLAARGCSGVIESQNPNFMNISSIICGSLGSIKTSADFNSRANSAASSKGWCVYLLHGIDNDGGYSPLSSDTLRASLEYLKANPDKFWVTSFGNVAKYICERNGASITEIQATNDTITVIESDTLDPVIYNCPLTIRRSLPQGWSSAYVVQNGDTIASQIVQVDSIKYLMFDVLPDNGVITLIRSRTTGLKSENILTFPSSFELQQNYPNPFNPATVIGYQLPTTSRISLKVYSLLGQEVATLFEGVRQPGKYEATFDGSRLASGVFLYRLSTDNFAEVKKSVLLK